MRALFLPPTYQDSAEAGRLILRDGSTAFLRVSEPTDREPMREFFQQLSPESKRRRFFSIADPAEALLERQCDSSNPRVQLTLIVSRLVGGASRIIATGGYVARNESSAEVAFAVDDEFQRKGLGGLLLERLALLAARNGFVRFWAMTRIENSLMLETFRQSGLSLHTKVEDECVEIDFSVAPSADSVTYSETRDRVFTTASLHPFFCPRSVAVVGASREPASIGYRILDALVQSGFRGPIHAVNPSATRVRGIATLSSARDLPVGTDLAVLAIPREAVPAAVEDCAAAGVRALVVVTAGFAEANAGGRALQETLVGRVRGHGMRVVGPNSMGLLNTDPAVLLNASVYPDLPPRGSVAMSSQSGALGLAMLALARQRHVGISTFISVGNRADISGNDLLQYWQEDDATRVILLYLESFGNPRRFARLARKVSLRKPIVVVKAGRRTAPAETPGPDAPSLVAGDAVVDALFRQTGVIRADTLDELFDIAAALDRQPLPRGRRVAILSDGSGPGVLCAGACEGARLIVPPLSEATAAKLASFLPASTTIGNPLELVFSTSAEPFRKAVETLLAAPEVDSLIAIHSLRDPTGSHAIQEAIRRGAAAARAAGATGRPLLACLVAKEDAGPPLLLLGESVPTYAFPESAARVLGKVAAYAEWRAASRGIIPDFDEIDPAAARETCGRALAESGAGWLEADDVRAVLAAMHLPVGPQTEDRASGAAARESGKEEVEVRVSMLEDSSFGPLILFGLGGIYLDLVSDSAVRVTPLTDRAAAAMVREIRGYPLLEGYRGHPPADIESIHDLLLRISRLVEEVPDIAELTVSPIFVGSPGRGCRIVDARIRVAPPRKGQTARYTTPAVAPPRSESPSFEGASHDRNG
ncbi:MAG: acetate--CoA ligase family protein [Thermoanaerobaculia bacterium]